MTMNPKAIVCDIEGTTTSISFVKDILFPYAEKNLDTYIRNNWANDKVQLAVTELKRQAIDDQRLAGAVTIDDSNDETCISSLIEYTKWLMKNDRKVTGLKNLQGQIWETGYNEGTLKGDVYDDVPIAFNQWVSEEKPLYIYSSGSIHAQKLLFANTIHGNLLTLISGHFDTTTGPKQDKTSYIKIAESLQLSPNEILFLTDIVKEAEAARDAQMQVIMLDRPGNYPLTTDERNKFQIVTTFSEIKFN